MKYFIDTEFLEGTQTKRILGIPYGKTKPTIDLISIGMVAEDGREYYAISKDFNLYEAWNRYDLKPDIDNGGMKKVYWIRENVLKPIFEELIYKQYMGLQNDIAKEFIDLIKKNARPFDFFKSQFLYNNRNMFPEFSYNELKILISKYGKTNEQIANGILHFTNGVYTQAGLFKDTKPEFYAYYADYDWVAFCWLFGKMMNLPKGFPMYCIDLKQELDGIADVKRKSTNLDTKQMVETIKGTAHYPKQTNEHNALSDARWNKELYEFINTL